MSKSEIIIFFSFIGDHSVLWATGPTGTINQSGERELLAREKKAAVS